MKSHSYGGAIREHFTTVHDRRPKVVELVQNTTIVHREPQRKRLAVAEAVSIALRRPKLNVQCEFDFVLPSCRRRVDPAPAVGGAPRQEDAVDVEGCNARPTRRATADDAQGGARRSLRPLPHRL